MTKEAFILAFIKMQKFFMFKLDDDNLEIYWNFLKDYREDFFLEVCRDAFKEFSATTAKPFPSLAGFVARLDEKTSEFNRDLRAKMYEARTFLYNNYELQARESGEWYDLEMSERAKKREEYIELNTEKYIEEKYGRKEIAKS